MLRRERVSGFRFQGSGFSGSGFRFRVFGFRVLGSGSRVQGSGGAACADESDGEQIAARDDRLQVRQGGGTDASA